MCACSPTDATVHWTPCNMHVVAAHFGCRVGRGWGVVGPVEATARGRSVSGPLYGLSAARIAAPRSRPSLKCTLQSSGANKRRSCERVSLPRENSSGVSSCCGMRTRTPYGHVEGSIGMAVHRNWRGIPPPPGTPPPKTKGTIVGKNETNHWENLVGPLLVHTLLGPPPPPPSSLLIIPGHALRGPRKSQFANPNQSPSL